MKTRLWQFFFVLFLAVLIVPALCQASGAILTNSNPNHTITSGCDEQVYGTSSFNQITLERGARAELFNFPGQNSIQIQSSSYLFTVSRSGAVVTFQGSDGTFLKMPATIEAQTISFNGEEIRVLQIYNNQVVLDDQVIGTTPIDLGSIDDEENTITLDPQSIGGVGSQILYGGVWHSTPIAVAEGYLVGIQVGTEYYLYHPKLGENVTFSEETNKRAVGYALFGRTSSDVQSNTAETPQRIVLSQSYLGEDRKKTELSTGVELEVIGSEIKLTNKYIRWVAINVHKNITAYSYETTTHYLSPASLATDSIDIAKALMPALALSGNTITISSENVFQIEVHGAVVRGTPVFSLTTWPDGLTEAKNADNDLVTNLNTLDLLHFGFRAFKNTVQLVPYECFDFVTHLFADLIELILLGQYTSDSRLTMANAAGLTTSVVNNLVNCFTSTASLGALELVHTTWDIIKATDWVLEDIVSGNYEIMYLDAYNTIDIITIDNFSIDPLDSFPDVSYIEGDPLNLLHFNFALIYSSYNDSINAQDKYFGYGMPEYTRRGVSSSKPTGYKLTTSDTSVKFTLPQSDLEIVKRNVTDQSVILAHSLSNLSATQNITVDDEKEEPEDGECVFTIALQDSRMQPSDPVPEVILDFCDPDTGEPSRVISYERRVENYGGYVYPYYYFKVRKGVELRTYARWDVRGGAVSGSLTSSSKQFDWSSRIPVDNPFYMAGGGYGKRYYRLSVRADVPSSFRGELFMDFYFALEESNE